MYHLEIDPEFYFKLDTICYWLKTNPEALKSVASLMFNIVYECKEAHRDVHC